MVFKPMRSVAPDESKYPITFPKWASPKLDGIRVVKHQGKALSKALKPIPNNFTRRGIEAYAPEGLDSEIIIGAPNESELTYNRTYRAVMTHSGEPDFKLYAFDVINEQTAKLPADTRLELLRELVKGNSRIIVVPQTVVNNREELQAVYENFLNQGYEGAILRDPNGRYKFGRCTAKEQIQLKLKPEDDFDAVVLEIIEAEQNNNEAFTNELGETDRSTHQANKVGKGMLGAFIVRDLLSGLTFRVGPGKMKHEERIKTWEEFKKTGAHIGRYIKYRSMTYGVLKEGAARHGRFYGWRDAAEIATGL